MGHSGHWLVGHQADGSLSQWVTEPMGQGYNVCDVDLVFFANRGFFFIPLNAPMCHLGDE